MFVRFGYGAGSDAHRSQEIVQEEKKELFPCDNLVEIFGLIFLKIEYLVLRVTFCTTYGLVYTRLYERSKTSHTTKSTTPCHFTVVYIDFFFEKHLCYMVVAVCNLAHVKPRSVAL